MSLRDLLSQLPGGRVVGLSATEDLGFDAQGSDETSAIDAPLLEGSEFRAIRVVERGITEFQQFLDGTQKSWRVGYVGLNPLTLAWVAAGRLSRVDRLVVAPDPNAWASRCVLLVPTGTALVPTAEFEVVEVFAEEGRYLEESRKRVERLRTELELSLVGPWWEPPSWLMVDGGIGEFLSRTTADAPMVGVVKSHQRQYVKSPDRVETLLGLRPGERSTAFLRAGTPVQGVEAASFYLKLHDRPHESPFFGLIRVELPMAHLSRADEIAGWLLAERAPLSLPDSRFDRLLYPIHAVEDHLKARRPSDARIRGIQGI